MRKFLIVVISLGLFCKRGVDAEIQEVVLKWNAQTCLDKCTFKLQQDLKVIPGAAQVSINARAGAAVIHWLPQARFSYQAINFATRQTGIKVLDARLKVSGYLSYSETDKSYQLTSFPDQSLFNLLGPATPEGERYVIEYSLYTRPIPPRLEALFKDAILKSEPVWIEGPLFQPLRYSNFLTVDKFKFVRE